MKEQQLSHEERLKRVWLLCAHFARNMAYYRAAFNGEESSTPHRSEFWKTATGNFIDMAILEWCKLYADPKAHHYWRKVVGDGDKFYTGLLEEIGMDAAAMASEIEAIKKYRDKFVAHLDSERVMNIPRLDIMWSAVQYYFNYVTNVEMTDDERRILRFGCLDVYFSACYEEARTVYLQHQP